MSGSGGGGEMAELRAAIPQVRLWPLLNTLHLTLQLSLLMLVLQETSTLVLPGGAGVVNAGAGNVAAPLPVASAVPIVPVAGEPGPDGNAAQLVPVQGGNTDAGAHAAAQILLPPDGVVQP
jgi:hypothetical protein